ncbi:hypothetical protein D3C78_1462790 [compost metagenome]
MLPISQYADSLTNNFIYRRLAVQLQQGFNIDIQYAERFFFCSKHNLLPGGFTHRSGNHQHGQTLASGQIAAGWQCICQPGSAHQQITAAELLNCLRQLRQIAIRFSINYHNRWPVVAQER